MSQYSKRIYAKIKIGADDDFTPVLVDSGSECNVIYEDSVVNSALTDSMTDSYVEIYPLGTEKLMAEKQLETSVIFENTTRPIHVTFVVLRGKGPVVIGQPILRTLELSIDIAATRPDRYMLKTSAGSDLQYWETPLYTSSNIKLEVSACKMQLARYGVAYLPALCQGRKLSVLLDTGSMLNIIDRQCLQELDPNMRIAPCNIQWLHGAGIRVEVVGQVDLSLAIDLVDGRTHYITETFVVALDSGEKVTLGTPKDSGEEQWKPQPEPKSRNLV